MHKDSMSKVFPQNIGNVTNYTFACMLYDIIEQKKFI